MKYLDANVWVYALMAKDQDPKRVRALELIEMEPVLVSLQVINEVCRVLTKKGNASEERVRSVIYGFYRQYSILQVGEEDLMKASELRERYRLSFWDGIHVAVALRSSATILYSEDMHDGLIVEGTLTIRNPFR